MQLLMGRLHRICIQGNHGREHHIGGRARQGLCRSYLAEEGACTCCSSAGGVGHDIEYF